LIESGIQEWVLPEKLYIKYGVATKAIPKDLEEDIRNILFERLEHKAEAKEYIKEVKRIFIGRMRKVLLS
jgi:hypothetical protein